MWKYETLCKTFSTQRTKGTNVLCVLYQVNSSFSDTWYDTWIGITYNRNRYNIEDSTDIGQIVVMNLHAWDQDGSKSSFISLMCQTQHSKSVYIFTEDAIKPYIGSGMAATRKKAKPEN